MNYGLQDIITLLGALGLFLYGMKVMSDALINLAGDRMRTFLAASTSNRFIAIFTGFAMTAAMQSSTATTMMVVSFTNAGLLTLTESIGVIMGANIGTTLTAWLISIIGFKLSLSSISIPLVGFGFLMTLSKKERMKNAGYFVIGFALLFVGLQYIKDSLPDLAQNPEALRFLADYSDNGFFSVILFLIIGTVITLVVQASSAALALTLVMAYHGWINFDMAAAMVLGQNIGTTLTANMAAMVANVHAKRAARAHLLFNLIGVIPLLVVFFPFTTAMAAIIEWTNGASPYQNPLVIPVALSLFHSCFNILNTAILVGFIPQIAELATRLVPEKVGEQKEIDEPEFLDESSLKYVTSGIKALKDESTRLLQKSAYEVLAHGLRIHREVLESEKHVADLTHSHPYRDLDIDRLYTQKIKSIYSQIVEFSTQLQSRFALDSDQVDTIRRILIANRLLIEVIKRMTPLHANLNKYIESENEVIRNEYNYLRRKILKVVRIIKYLGSSEDIEEQLAHLRYEREKANHLDVLLSGRVAELLKEKSITREMATSLMNDSSNASRIIKNLIDIAGTLFQPEKPEKLGLEQEQKPHSIKFN